MSELPPVGVEEEFLLVDRGLEPAPNSAAAPAEAERRGITLRLELSGFQVETTLQRGCYQSGTRRSARPAAAGRCRSGRGCWGSTSHLRAPAGDAARVSGQGDRAASAGCVKFGMIAHEQGICGCQMHVQVPGRVAVIQSAIGCGPGCRLSLRCRLIRQCTVTLIPAMRVGAASCGVAGRLRVRRRSSLLLKYDSTVRMLVDSEVILALPSRTMLTTRSGTATVTRNEVCIEPGCFSGEDFSCRGNHRRYVRPTPYSPAPGNRRSRVK
jgi:glutamate---cysteine ligase / carboxylate-amine ligase